MEKLILFWGIFAGLAAHAGHDGNGADGVILPNGSVILYDLYERNIDGDEVIRLVRNQEPHHVVRNFIFEEKAFVFDEGRGEFGSLWDIRRRDNLEMIQTLGYLLYEISMVSPRFALIIANEIKQLDWQEAPGDLKPNPDTQAPLDTKIIGCARTTNRFVLYSPTCSQNMSAAQRAALVLHEAIYSVYKRQYPQVESSFDIRTLVAKTFKTNNKETLRDVFEKTHLSEILIAEDQDWTKANLPDRLNSYGLTCDFSEGPAQNLEFTFYGFYGLYGTFNGKYFSTNSTGRLRKDHWQYRYNDNNLGAYTAKDINFDFASKVLRFEIPLLDYTEIKVTVNLSDRKSITASYIFEELVGENDTDGPIYKPRQVNGSCK